MKKFILSILFPVIFCFSSLAEFGILSSAVCLSVNGASGFYATQNVTGQAATAASNFGGSLGAFGNNSGNLKIIGASINTFKVGTGAVCSGTLFYTVYQQGHKPVSPAFTAINLNLYSSLNNNQQWQDLSNAVDLTTLAVGNYTLEIYYASSGSDLAANCSQQKLDNASGANYTANFIISFPLALNFSSLYGIVNDASIEIKWAMQNDADILSYEVQKSGNGLNFTTTGTVISQQTGTANNYYYKDVAPLIGTNYYRIKANYNNSTINLSNVIRLYFETVANSILIYPNPTANILIARLAGISKSNYQLSVLNSGGQTILTMPLAHNGIDETLHINLPQTLAKGVYWLFLIDKIQFYKQSFMVK